MLTLTVENIINIDTNDVEYRTVFDVIIIFDFIINYFLKTNF